MRQKLVRPEPLPYVEDRDIELLAADLGAGHFSAAELYRWYELSVIDEGRKPVSKKAFGTALKTAGLQPSTRWIGDERKAARCWLITRSWQRRGQALLADEKRKAEGR